MIDFNVLDKEIDYFSAWPLLGAILILIFSTLLYEPGLIIG